MEANGAHESSSQSSCGRERVAEGFWANGAPLSHAPEGSRAGRGGKGSCPALPVIRAPAAAAHRGIRMRRLH